MAKKKTRQLPELPLLLCVHCSQMTPIPCSPRAWKWASEKCPTMKQAEYDFYKRVGGGPVAMTSMTRGRGFSGVLHDNDHHVGSYHGALTNERIYGHWAGPRWQQAYVAMADDDSG